MELSVTFRQRFNEARQQSGLSLNRLGRISANSPSKMQAIANGEYDGSKDGPGLFGVHRAVAPLGVTIDQLAPPIVQPRPGINAFLSCFSGKDTPIESFGRMLDFCDVYKEPSGSRTHLARVGPKSLLVSVSGIWDPALLQIEYERWPAKRRKTIYQRQRFAWQRGHCIDSETYQAKFIGTSKTMSFSLMLAACRVRDYDGSSTQLIYAEPLLR
mmetsp:Transcript_27660/g.51385  ORF Transcript_27660/g.51385 Transcript_27660/m.51385 type:complete len:214 (-) Transcript_27660:1298-1939(-)